MMLVNPGQGAVALALFMALKHQQLLPTNQRDWFEEQAMRRLLVEEHGDFVELALASDPKAAEFLGPKSGAH